MASLQIHQATIATIADRIVQARKLHGKDSSYAIGLFAGIELLAGDDGDVSRQIQARVLELEGGQSATDSQTPKTSGRSKGESPRPQESEAPPVQGTDLAENTWIRGAVKWFNNDKGYGFISTDANTDVFVHWRDISSWDRSLTQGDPVEFMVTKTAKGFQAINVMKPDAGDAQQTAAPNEGAATQPQSDQAAGETPNSATQASVTQTPVTQTPAQTPVTQTPVSGAPAPSIESRATSLTSTAADATDETATPAPASSGIPAGEGREAAPTNPVQDTASQTAADAGVAGQDAPDEGSRA